MFYIYENGVLSKVLLPDGYLTPAGTGFTYHFYIKDHQGNVRVVMNKNKQIEQVNHYYPFGGLFAESTAGAWQKYKYSGKELDRMNGLDLYDFSARAQDPMVGRFTSIDPFCEKYYSISPYAYCLNNPVNAIDPDGRSTWVMTNRNGTYRVVGGDLDDDDRNIYVYTLKDGRLKRGASIGITTSTTSFYDSDLEEGKGGWSIGSTIDPGDRSGDNFLSEIIGKNPPMFNDYMANAGNKGKYDFKVSNGGNKEYLNDQFYRGMPIGTTGDGQTIYTSARDIGNITAGYVAGSNGMSWGASRAAFDAYQVRVNGSFEGISTRNAEYYGWRMGYNYHSYTKTVNLTNSIKSGIKVLWKHITK